MVVSGADDKLIEVCDMGEAQACVGEGIGCGVRGGRQGRGDRGGLSGDDSMTWTQMVLDVEEAQVGRGWGMTTRSRSGTRGGG